MLNINSSTYFTSKNLAQELDDDELRKLSNDLHILYEADKTSREDWETNLADAIKLANQVIELKTYPWPNASNVKYPLLTIAALQFNARSYPALVPPRKLVKGKTIGFDGDGTKAESAIRIGKYMTYQILHEMDEWEDDMDKLCMVLPLVGTAFKKTYFDPVKEQNVSELVLPQDLVINYYAKSIDTATCKTHRLYLYPNEIEGYFRDGTYRRVELLTSTLDDKELDDTRVTGVEAPVVDHSRPFEVLEMHCEYDLDNDGIAEPYIVTILKERKEVLRIVPRFKKKDAQYIGDQLIRIKPTEYFTGFQFIPNAQSGIYGIGFGKLLGPLNESINTILNILIDSGHLATIQGGFIAKGTRIRAGDTQFRPGEWKLAQTTGDDLRKNIVPLPVKEPSGVLFSLLGMLTQSAEKLSSTTDIMTGDMPGQNTKATVMMQAIEQGAKVHTTIHKRMYRSMAKEFQKLYRLNQDNLPYQTYFTALDGDVTEAVYRKDFDPKHIDVIPAADPNIATEEQRLGRVQALLDVLPMIPNQPEAVKRYLEATDQPGIDVLMQAPQKQPTLEEMQLQFEQQKFTMEHQLAMFEAETERLRVEHQAIRDDANSALSLAKVEEIKDKPFVELEKETTKRMATNTQAAIKLKEIQDKKQAQGDKSATDTQT